MLIYHFLFIMILAPVGLKGQKEVYSSQTADKDAINVYILSCCDEHYVQFHCLAKTLSTKSSLKDSFRFKDLIWVKINKLIEY